MAEREIEGLPEVLHAPLLEAVRRIQEDGIEVTLVGGLAVRLLASRLRPSSDRLDDPSALAAFGRGTLDIDLAVAREQVDKVESVLRTLDYQPVPEGKPGLQREDVRIDVLQLGRRVGADFTLSIDSLAGEAAQLQGLTIRVATRAELIVLKSVAWSDRHRPKDLADIGTLGLIDQIDGGSARQALEDGLNGRLRDDLRRDLRKVLGKFGGPEDQGPLAFVNEIVKARATAEQLSGVVEYEQVVASIVSDAVRTVLAGIAE